MREYEVCISNVPTTTNLAEIQNIFKTFGSIEVKLCALINFPSKEQADSFINTYDQYNLNGTDIQVSLKENKATSNVIKISNLDSKIGKDFLGRIVANVVPKDTFTISSLDVNAANSLQVATITVQSKAKAKSIIAKMHRTKLFDRIIEVTWEICEGEEFSEESRKDGADVLDGEISSDDEEDGEEEDKEDEDDESEEEEDEEEDEEDEDDEEEEVEEDEIDDQIALMIENIEQEQEIERLKKEKEKLARNLRIIDLEEKRNLLKEEEKKIQEKKARREKEEQLKKEIREQHEMRNIEKEIKKMQEKMARREEEQRKIAEIADLEARLVAEKAAKEEIGKLKAELERKKKMKEEIANLAGKRAALEMEKDTSPPNWGATEGWEAWQSVNVHYYDVSSLDDKGSMVENNARNAAEVRMKLKPFDMGTFRIAYYAQLKIGGTVKNMVAKKHIENVERAPEQIKTLILDDMFSQITAIKFAQQYSATGALTKSLTFAEPVLLSFSSGNFLFAEPILEGVWKRFGNNSGYVARDEVAATVQAFPHYTYQISADLQGSKTASGYLLTDPAIHCTNITKFGESNCGEKGMIKYFESHQCNSLCTKLGLIRHPKQVLPNITDGTMAR